MLLWIVFAILTAAAVALVALPLARRRPAAGQHDAAASPDLAVYKAQLGELDRDVERGVIAPSEAEAARIEISRRLLAEQDRQAALPAAGSPASTRASLGGVVVAVPALALAGYLLLGSPQLPGQPMAERMQHQAETQDMELLVARVEKHLAANPEDGRGWDVLAPVYRRMGRFNDAARAYASAIRLLGETPERAADYGEMLVAADDGLVNADARSAFERALKLDSTAVKPRFFLALGLEQDGARDAAVAAWSDLLALPGEADAPWRERVREHLAALGAPLPPGPTSEQVAAASQMSSGDRQAMIESMVAGLAERLANGGGSIDEWLRLIRAYGVLGKAEEARSAIATARAQFTGDNAALGRIDAAAAQIDNGS